MNRSIWLRPTISVIFVGLRLVPFGVRRFSHHADNNVAINKSAALANHGFYFEEVSHAAGVTFIHQAPTLDSKLAGIMPQIASMGASTVCRVSVSSSSNGAIRRSVQDTGYPKWSAPPAACRCSPMSALDLARSSGRRSPMPNRTS